MYEQGSSDRTEKAEIGVYVTVIGEAQAETLNKHTATSRGRFRGRRVDEAVTFHHQATNDRASAGCAHPVLPKLTTRS